MSVDILSGLLTFVDNQINKNKSVDPIPFIQKSAIEKPANNPYKNLHDVACQDTIRLSQAEIVEPKSPSKSTEIKSSTSTLKGQQNKDKKMLVALQPVWPVPRPV